MVFLVLASGISKSTNLSCFPCKLLIELFYSKNITLKIFLRPDTIMDQVPVTCLWLNQPVVNMRD